MYKLYFFLLILSLSSCKREIDYSNLQDEDIHNERFDASLMEINDNDDVEIYHDHTGQYPDGTYCAEVEYYNPNSGTRNTYELNVEVEDGDLTIIHWPNGGWLDETHFSPEDISNGEISFTSDRGYTYTVLLGDYGGNCYSDGQQLQDDVNYDTRETTCPICGEEMTGYEDLCYSCEKNKEEVKEKNENTCPMCGGYKSSFDEHCDNCQDKLDNEQ